jgi:hypothetical protein
MTVFEILILITSVIGIALAIGIYVNYGQPSLEDLTEDLDQDFEEKVEVKETKEIFPSRRLTESAQELVKEIERVTGGEVTQEGSIKTVEDLTGTLTTPLKKKRKYYPKNKK